MMLFLALIENKLPYIKLRNILRFLCGLFMKEINSMVLNNKKNPTSCILVDPKFTKLE